MDYSGGWGTHGRAVWKNFKNACGPYRGPAIPWLVAACTARDGSHWALQRWQRSQANFGVAPWKPGHGAWELRLSHWHGEAARLEVWLDWSYSGRWHHLFGRLTYLGQPLYGFATTLRAARPTATGASSTSTRSTRRTGAAGGGRTASSRSARTERSATGSSRTGSRPASAAARRREAVPDRDERARGSRRTSPGRARPCTTSARATRAIASTRARMNALQQGARAGLEALSRIVASSTHELSSHEHEVPHDLQGWPDLRAGRGSEALADATSPGRGSRRRARHPAGSGRPDRRCQGRTQGPIALHERRAPASWTGKRSARSRSASGDAPRRLGADRVPRRRARSLRGRVDAERRNGRDPLGEPRRGGATRPARERSDSR